MISYEGKRTRVASGRGCRVRKAGQQLSDRHVPQRALGRSYEPRIRRRTHDRLSRYVKAASPPDRDMRLPRIIKLLGSERANLVGACEVALLAGEGRPNPAIVAVLGIVLHLVVGAVIHRTDVLAPLDEGAQVDGIPDFGLRPLALSAGTVPTAVNAEKSVGTVVVVRLGGVRIRGHRRSRRDRGGRSCQAAEPQEGTAADDYGATAKF